MKLAVFFNEIDSEIDVQFIQDQCTFITDYGPGISFSENNYTFSADLGEIYIIHGSGETYTGEYDVIPRVYSQTLYTKDKSMLDNVTVEIIPLTKTINLSNGYTVTIG